MKLRPHLAFSGVLLLFFASGFSALLYQVIWQRMLGCFAGVDVYSVTITVSAFMGGLGCGNAAGGHLADKLSDRRGIFVFCAAEAVIAIFALLSKSLYYDLLYLRWSGLGNSSVLLPLVLFLSLLVPTFCMGLTLPLLAKSFTAKVESASSIVGYLYGLNTLGAAVGAITTIWFLLRWHSFQDILRLGATLNALSAIGAAAIWWTLRSSRSDAAIVRAPAEAAFSVERARFSFSVWLLIYGLSGFLALALEIVWFRFFAILQKSTAFTFGNLLGIFLFGLAFGVLAGVPLARRCTRPARTFLGLQTAITLYAVGALSLFVLLAVREDGFRALWPYLRQYETLNPAELISLLPSWLMGGDVTKETAANLKMFGLVYFALPLVLIAPATCMMGLSFPLLQRVVQVSPALLGRRVGWLQTLNIAGSLLGATLVGWCSLHLIGTAGTLRALVILSGIFALLFAWQLSTTSRRWTASVVAIGVFALLALSIPGEKKLWAKLHGTTPEAIIVSESHSGLSLLKIERTEQTKGRIWVFTNGLGQSWLPYGSVHTMIGMVGAMLHPKPEEVAIIGLGSGDTVFALGGSPLTKEMTCIEIVRPVYETLLELVPQVPYPALRTLMSDARVQWHFTDARTYLQRSGKLYDIIEADALRPSSAYSGNLYSREYFRMLRSRLKPGGLAVTWVPTERVLKTFRHVFPHVLVVDGVALGSEEEIEVDPPTLAARLSDPFTANYYAQIGSEIEPLLAALVSGQFQRYTPADRAELRGDLNSDLFPRDEFGFPQG